MSLDPPEKLIVGEHSPASVVSVFRVYDTWVLLSVTWFPSSSFIQIPDFCANLQKSHLLFLSSKICETKFVAFLEMASF